MLVAVSKLPLFKKHTRDPIGELLCRFIYNMQLNVTSCVRLVGLPMVKNAKKIPCMRAWFCIVCLI